MRIRRSGQLLEKLRLVIVSRDSEYWKTYNASPERKAKKAEQDRKRHSTPESRAKKAEYLQQYRRSEEYKSKEAERGARRRADPEEAAKRKARQAVYKAVKSGKLVKLACQECGDPNSQAHHKDYGKPLEVEWYCQKCHTNKYHMPSLKHAGVA